MPKFEERERERFVRKIFSVLYVKDTYLQMEIEEEFVNNSNTYRILPLQASTIWIGNSTILFQRFIDDLLQGFLIQKNYWMIL